MSKKDLIPLNKRTPKERKAIQSKGGRSKSPRKQLQSRINGILSSKKSSTQQKFLAQLMKDNDILGLIKELIFTNMEEADSFKKRDMLIGRLQALLPQKILQLNASVEKQDLKDIKKVDETIEKILGGKKNDN